MRTTVTIETDELQDLVKLSHAKSKSRAVSMAIRAYVRRQRLQELLALRGQLTFDRTVLRLRHRER